MKKWLIGLTIALSTASCATNQQNGKLNDLEARIQVLELKQSETLKELQTIEQRLTQINLELSQLQTKFAQNLLKATDSFEMEVDFKDIKEFPKSDIENAKKRKMINHSKYRY